MKIVELPAPELRKMIGSKAISPIELNEVYRAYRGARSLRECYGGHRLRAARRAASGGRRCDARAAWSAAWFARRNHGLEATAGLLTTHGSPLYRDLVPAEDNLLSRACGRQARSSSARLWCKLGRRARNRSCFGDLSELKEPPSKSRAK